MNRSNLSSVAVRQWIAGVLFGTLWIGALAAQAGGVVPATGADDAAIPVTTDAEEDLVQLSFSGASIDVVTKWLAETTQKSLIKHKDVSCSLTIMSSRKLSRREAITLVYDALALEGFTAVENHSVVYIVPEKEAGKVSAEVMNGGTDTLAGRQIGVRFFDLKHAKAAVLGSKIKGILSKEATLEVDERANKIVVKDYVDNVRLVAELLSQLDIPTEADSVTRVYTLQHTQAEQIATLLSAVFAGAGMKPTAKKKPPQKGKPAPKPSPSTGSPVIILPDSFSNRLVVTAPAERIVEIKELIDTLDTERPADVAVRVIALAHVDAEELVGEVGSMYRKIRGQSVKDTIEISSNDRSNSLIVLSSQSNYNQIAELVRALDTEDAQQKSTRTFQLEHADPEEIVSQLEDLFEDSSNNYNYGWGWGGSRRGSNGQGEVRFVPNRRRSEIIAIGAPSLLERVGETIAMLDEPVDEEYLAPKIYQLKYVAADDIKTVLDELFDDKEEDRPYWYDDSNQEESGVGRLTGKVKFATEPYSNSIIVTTNSDENFSVVESLLRQLDTQFPDREATFNVQLNHAKSITVANNLNILFARQGAPGFRRQPANRNNNNNRNRNDPSNATSEGFELDDDEEVDVFYPWLGGQGGNNNRGRGSRVERPVSDLVGKVRIVPDQRTNALLVTTAPHFIHQVRQVVSDLDVPTAQVLIEAKIIEVSIDDRERMGIRWGPSPLNLDPDDLDNSIVGLGTAINRETYVGSVVADALREGTLSSVVNLDALVQFLRKSADSRVRAEPRLNVADNERGKLFVGSRIPFIDNTITTDNGGQNATFEYKDVGIILEVTPNINANDEVALKVRVEASQIRAGETLFGGAIIDTRNYKTELTVKNEEILVLGGIIQREQTEVVRKIPILGDIPLLGALFRKRDTVDREVELMVFLRPVVTRSPEEVRELMRREREKIRNIELWERELEAEREKRKEEEGQ